MRREALTEVAEAVAEDSAAAVVVVVEDSVEVSSKVLQPAS